MIEAATTFTDGINPRTRSKKSTHAVRRASLIDEGKTLRTTYNHVQYHTKQRAKRFQHQLRQLNTQINQSHQIVKNNKIAIIEQEKNVLKHRLLESLRGKFVTNEPWRPTTSSTPTTFGAMVNNNRDTYRPVRPTSTTTATSFTVNAGHRRLQPAEQTPGQTPGQTPRQTPRQTPQQTSQQTPQQERQKQQKRPTRPSWKPTRDVESLDPTSKEDILYDPSTARPLGAHDDAHYQYYLKQRQQQQQHTLRRKRPTTAATAGRRRTQHKSAVVQRPSTSNGRRGDRSSSNRSASKGRGAASYNCFSSPRLLRSSDRIKEKRIDVNRYETKLDGHDGRLELRSPLYVTSVYIVFIVFMMHVVFH